MKLYTDPKKRTGFWRLKLPSGKFKTIQAPNESTARLIAENLLHELIETPQLDAWSSLIEMWISKRERDSAGLTVKPKWPQYRTELRAWGRRMSKVAPPGAVELPHFLEIWEQLTRHQQDNVKPELGRFTKWLIMSQHIPAQFNPMDYLDKKEKPAKRRRPLTLEAFKAALWEAEQRDYKDLALAMQLSKVTTLRRGDIARLRFDENVADGALRVKVSKSFAVHGEVKGIRLEWKFDEHPAVYELVKQCKLLSVMNDDCPYLISNNIGKLTNQKQHPYQVPELSLTKRFTEIMRAVDGRSERPTFHEIRSLAAFLLETQGVGLEDIKQIMAHTDVDTTEIYLAGHERRWVPVVASNVL